jgi:hypothetical protein
VLPSNLSEGLFESSEIDWFLGTGVRYPAIGHVLWHTKHKSNGEIVNPTGPEGTDLDDNDAQVKIHRQIKDQSILVNTAHDDLIIAVRDKTLPKPLNFYSEDVIKLAKIQDLWYSISEAVKNKANGRIKLGPHPSPRREADYDEKYVDADEYLKHLEWFFPNMFNNKTEKVKKGGSGRKKTITQSDPCSFRK